jgi:hypothetical protein
MPVFSQAVLVLGHKVEGGFYCHLQVNPYGGGVSSRDMKCIVALMTAATPP